jgi:hypothetical protein
LAAYGLPLASESARGMPDVGVLAVGAGDPPEPVFLIGVVAWDLLVPSSAQTFHSP